MKIIALLLMAYGITYGATNLTYTTAEVQQGLDNALGVGILCDTLITNAQSTSFATVAPASGYVNSFAGGTNITVNTNGTFTCNFDGKVSAKAFGSFNVSSGTSDAEGHWFEEENDTGYGFQRSISGNSIGSFAAGSGAITVTNGSAITFRTKAASGTPDYVFYDLHLEVNRID